MRHAAAAAAAALLLLPLLLLLLLCRRHLLLLLLLPTQGVAACRLGGAPPICIIAAPAPVRGRSRCQTSPS